MNDHQLFRRTSAAEEQDLARLARLEYGQADLVNESMARWNSYSEAHKDAIIAQGNAIYTDINAQRSAGLPATDPDVQANMARWHDHLRHFYEPSLDILRGLADTYVNDPRFRANFDKLHPELAEYVNEGIVQYVDDLETRVIAAMLDEDEARRRRLGG
jgi:hypothetical protein